MIKINFGSNHFSDENSYILDLKDKTREEILLEFSNKFYSKLGFNLEEISELEAKKFLDNNQVISINAFKDLNNNTNQFLNNFEEYYQDNITKFREEKLEEKFNHFLNLFNQVNEINNNQHNMLIDSIYFIIDINESLITLNKDFFAEMSKLTNLETFNFAEELYYRIEKIQEIKDVNLQYEMFIKTRKEVKQKQIENNQNKTQTKEEHAENKSFLKNAFDFLKNPIENTKKAIDTYYETKEKREDLQKQLEYLKIKLIEARNFRKSFTIKEIERYDLKEYILKQIENQNIALNFDTFKIKDIKLLEKYIIKLNKIVNDFESLNLQITEQIERTLINEKILSFSLTKSKQQEQARIENKINNYQQNISENVLEEKVENKTRIKIGI